MRCPFLNVRVALDDPARHMLRTHSIAAATVATRGAFGCGGRAIIATGRFSARAAASLLSDAAPPHS